MRAVRWLSLLIWTVLCWAVVFRPVARLVTRTATRQPGLKIRRGGRSEPYKYHWWLVNEAGVRWLPRVYVQYLKRPDLDMHANDYSWGDRHVLLIGWYQRVTPGGDLLTYVAGDSLPVEQPSHACPGGVWSLSLVLPHGTTRSAS